MRGDARARARALANVLLESPGGVGDKYTGGRALGGWVRGAGGGWEVRMDERFL